MKKKIHHKIKLMIVTIRAELLILAITVVMRILDRMSQKLELFGEIGGRS